VRNSRTSRRITSWTRVLIGKDYGSRRHIKKEKKRGKKYEISDARKRLADEKSEQWRRKREHMRTKGEERGDRGLTSLLTSLPARKKETKEGGNQT